ncbi:hypothetical protein EX30DRAFT_337252 [Ascodesmis nigricans]|uniref:Dynactin subunit 6 n=1 Tax=Ascodesmis nigricans TaxID=341454 RepID=A0A4S2N642_9PEZI|nr:hypothetical protein EX30DRAFT_337252 [Ascodesmis nigricans]
MGACGKLEHSLLHLLLSLGLPSNTAQPITTSTLATHRNITETCFQGSLAVPMAPKPRPSELPPAPKPVVHLAQSIVISEQASLTGNFPIRVGQHTVIHPRAKLNSLAGPITIGDFCIVSERALIAAPDQDGLEIESYVVIETNAVVEARRVGEGTTVEVGVKIGKGAVVGSNCKITPLNKIEESEIVDDSTVIYGVGQRRIDISGSRDARRKLTEKQVEALKQLIPSNRTKFMS